MSSYTMQLSTLIEQPTQDRELPFDEMVEAGRVKLFDFSYPTLNEEFKKQFETDFIHHFWTREIGFETEQLFKLKLRNWLNMHMPYWVKMLETDSLISEPLVNVNWTRTLDSNRDSKGNVKNALNQLVENKDTMVARQTNDTNSTGESEGFTQNVASDTPDSRLSLTTNSEGRGTIEYASAINQETSKAESKTLDRAVGTQSGSADNKNTTRANTVNDTIENVAGKEVEVTKGNMGMKTESEMIDLYRRILVKWEVDIFKDMNQLFMLVY